jgi:hypothetical protein
VLCGGLGTLPSGPGGLEVFVTGLPVSSTGVMLTPTIAS